MASAFKITYEPLTQPGTESNPVVDQITFKNGTPRHLRFEKRSDLINYLYRSNRDLNNKQEVIDDILAMKYYSGENRPVYYYLFGINDETMVGKQEARELYKQGVTDVYQYFNLIDMNRLYDMHYDIKDLNEFDDPNEYDDEFDTDDEADKVIAATENQIKKENASDGMQE